MCLSRPLSSSSDAPSVTPASVHCISSCPSNQPARWCACPPSSPRLHAAWRAGWRAAVWALCCSLGTSRSSFFASRVRMLIIGLALRSEDFCASTGITRTRSRIEMLFPRSQMVVTAKAHGLSAIVSSAFPLCRPLRSLADSFVRRTCTSRTFLDSSQPNLPYANALRIAGYASTTRTRPT